MRKVTIRVIFSAPVIVVLVGLALLVGFMVLAITCSLGYY